MQDDLQRGAPPAAEEDGGPGIGSMDGSMNDSPNDSAAERSDGLIDRETMSRVAADCEWSLEHLGRFYLEGTRAELVKIEAACADGVAAEVERLAHGCAGASSTCGVTGMARLFERLEAAAGGDRIETACGLLDEARRLLDRVEELLREPPP